MARLNQKDNWHLSWIWSIWSSPHLPLCLCAAKKPLKKLVNTSDRWLQRFSLSSGPFSTGCHSPSAAQTHLIPAEDSYSLSAFNRLWKVKGTLPVVHSEGFWQEATACFSGGMSAQIGAFNREGKRRRGGGGGAVERPSLRKQTSAEAAFRKPSNSSWLRVSLVPQQ